MKAFLLLATAGLAIAATAGAAQAGGKHGKLDRLMGQLSNPSAAAALRNTLNKLDGVRQVEELAPCPADGTSAPDPDWALEDLPGECLMLDGTIATLTTTGPAGKPNTTLWVRRGASNTATGTERGAGNQTVIIQE